jgi:hypothetical protein
MATADGLRAKLMEKANRNKRETTSSSSSGDNASFPFWNIPEGSSATIRFLPDGDVTNECFWVDRLVIKLPFEGIVGGEYPTDRKVSVTVPCVEMFDDRCPIMSETRPWWKDPAKENLARAYWKKKSFIFQGFVVDSGLEEKNAPASPIRRFVINPSIYDIIYCSVMDTEMEDLPTDYVKGRDFKITKTKKGEYPNYGSSQWALKTRSLMNEELFAIETHGLYNLKDYLGRRPDAEEIEVIKAMFHDSVDGKPFDATSYGKWYRAYGSRDDDGNSQRMDMPSAPAASYNPPPQTARAAAPAPAPAPAPSQAAAPSEGGPPVRADAAAILERIRNRSQAQR